MMSSFRKKKKKQERKRNQKAAEVHLWNCGSQFRRTDDIRFPS